MIRKDITEQLAPSGVLDIRMNGYIDFFCNGDGLIDTLAINGGVALQMNSGVALTSGAIYEFTLTVGDGDRVTFSNPPFRVIEFVP